MKNKILLGSVTVLSALMIAACGNGEKKETETTAAPTTEVTTATPTTTAPTTQVASNKQNTTEALPKDGVQRFKRIDKGGSTFLIYYFKDDIVYKQMGIYFYNPKGLGKSEEEVVQLLNKSQELYKDVTGIKSTVEKKDGEYIQTVIYDYQTIDWKELHRRDPNQFPATKPNPVKISEAAAKLKEKGYVEYTE